MNLTSSLRYLALLGALAAVGLPAARAQVISINFDSLTSGDPASLAAPAGISFHNSSLIPLYDEFGEPIPGSDFFQIDDSYDVARATNPLANDYGVAPSGALALNGLDQPLLLAFDTPTYVRSLSFVLDGSTYGFPGGFPGYVYTDNVGTVLTSFNILQDVPYLGISLTLNSVVQYLALPSAAFYDNFVLDVSPIPEPAMVGVLGALAALGAAAARRRGQAKA